MTNPPTRDRGSPPADSQSASPTDLVAFLLGTGCRIGEVIALQVEAIDWEARTISISITGNVIRVRWCRTGPAQRQDVLGTTGAIATSMELLDERGARDASPDGLLFPDTQDGWRDPHNTGARLRDAVRRAGYGWVTTHVFARPQSPFWVTPG